MSVRKIMVSIILTLLALASASCSFFTNKGIVGSWSLESITKTNVQTNAVVTQTVAELGYSQIFTFTEDGTFSCMRNNQLAGEGTYTYYTSNGYLNLMPDPAYSNDVTLGSGTSSVIDNVFDRGYFDSNADSNVAEIHNRIN